MRSRPPAALSRHSGLAGPHTGYAALEKAGVATVRGWRLPSEMMLWCVISMAFFRRISVRDVASRMNIMLSGQRPLVAPSAVVQGRQRLGSDAVQHVFALTQQSLHSAANRPTWSELRLLGVDGVVWRAPDTAENRALRLCQQPAWRHRVSPDAHGVSDGADQPFADQQRVRRLSQQQNIETSPDHLLTLLDSALASCTTGTR